MPLLRVDLIMKDAVESAVLDIHIHKCVHPCAHKAHARGHKGKMMYWYSEKLMVKVLMNLCGYKPKQICLIYIRLKKCKQEKSVLMVESVFSCLTLDTVCETIIWPWLSNIHYFTFDGYAPYFLIIKHNFYIFWYYYRVVFFYLCYSTGILYIFFVFIFHGYYI